MNEILSFTSNIFSGICYLPSIILALLGLGALIAFHELGHLLFAKLFNVYAPSFSIGFGPRLIAKKIGETVYTLSAIPLGGYVELAGAQEIGQGDQQHAGAKDERSFSQKPYWQKLIIISAGIIFNLLLAYSIFVFLFNVGAPCVGNWCKNYKPQVETVTSDSIALKAGVQADDIISSIDNQSVKTIEEVSNILKNIQSTPKSFTVIRNGEEKTLTLDLPQKTEMKSENDALNASAKQNGSLPNGIKLGVFWKVAPQSLANSFRLAYRATWSIILQIFQALKGITKKESGLGGPLMLIKVITDCASLGYKIFLFILAFISINLAVFNLLPLPIFDGGQALFYTIEAASGRPLSDQTRYIIHYLTWIFVILLMVYLMYSDIIFLFFTKKP